MFTNPAVAKRNALTGPGAWGVNLGVHKDFHIGERVKATLGADIDNLFNHFLFAPDSDYGGGGGPFAQLGDFAVGSRSGDAEGDNPVGRHHDKSGFRATDPDVPAGGRRCAAADSIAAADHVLTCC